MGSSKRAYLIVGHFQQLRCHCWTYFSTRFILILLFFNQHLLDLFFFLISVKQIKCKFVQRSLERSLKRHMKKKAFINWGYVGGITNILHYLLIGCNWSCWYDNVTNYYCLFAAPLGRLAVLLICHNLCGAVKTVTWLFNQNCFFLCAKNCISFQICYCRQSGWEQAKRARVTLPLWKKGDDAHIKLMWTNLHYLSG